MPSPIRPADWEHLSIVRESLSLDRLHVAMVGRDRRMLLDYAAALAVSLAEQDGWHIEKYDPQRLETLIVDLMLNRFDAALQTVSGHQASPSPRPPGCVLFIPDALTLPRAAFQQLIRLAGGTRDHRLRLVALFPSGSQACEERISWMGSRVARWDLDDDADDAYGPALFTGATGRASTPLPTNKRYRAPSRLLAAGAVASVLAVLPMVWPAISDTKFELPMHSQSDASDKRPTALAGTLGPESLPRRVVPVHDASPQADSEAEHGLRAETDELTQTEALKQ